MTTGEGLGDEFDREVSHGQNPYPFYAKARRDGPVFYSERFGLWFVADHDSVAIILHDPLTYSSENRSIKPKSWPAPVAEVMARRRHAQHLGNTDPPTHTRLRQILNQAFMPARVRTYEPIVTEVAKSLIAQLDGPPADLLAQFCYPFPLIVTLRVIGVPLADLDQCMEWCKQKSTLDFASETLSEQEQLDAAYASVEFIEYCDELVRQRRDHPTDDLISQLLTARVRGHDPLTEAEASDLLPLLIFAGHETTANLLGNLLWQLFSTDQLDRVRADRDLLDAAIEEGLRFDTPALGFIRRATREVELAGVRVPAGARLFLLFGSANHDESRWTDPETFQFPRPRATGHLAFGQGVHYCVGAPLARLETRVGLNHLLNAFPGLRLMEPVTEPERRAHLVLRTLKHLPVAW